MNGETGTSKTGAIPYTLTVNNLRIPVPATGRNELEYNGQEQTYLPNGLDPTYCEIISNTATNVIAGGSWNMAAVSLKDQNVKWDDDGPNTREYPFRITPKPVTVTVLDKQITAGQPAQHQLRPDLRPRHADHLQPSLLRHRVCHLPRESSRPDGEGQRLQQCEKRFQGQHRDHHGPARRWLPAG